MKTCWIPHPRFSLLAVCALLLGACARKTRDNPTNAHPAEEAAQQTQPTEEASAPTPRVPRDLPSSADAAPSGQPLPGIQLVRGEDLIHQIASSEAEATLVNVWASWCGPCRREFPMLQKLGRKLVKSKVELKFVTVDDASSHAEALAFAKTHGIAEPILAAARPLGPFKEAMSPQWPGMLPATFLFDKSGKLRYFWPGEVFESELLPIIGDLLKGKDIDGYAKVGLQRGNETRY